MKTVSKPYAMSLLTRSLFFLVLGLALGPAIQAQNPAQSPEGDWEGTLKIATIEMRLVLHVSKDDKGALKATLDSPDQNVRSIPLDSISVNNSEVKFELASAQVAYSGKLKADGTGVIGTWTQAGNSAPLDFARPAPRTAAKPRTPKPSDIDGSWDGVLDAGAQTLRVSIHILTYDDGMTATLDSLDQNLTGVPVSSITREGTKVTLELKQFGATYKGTFDAELRTLTGEWSQGPTSLPLVLKRAAAQGEKKE